MNQFVPGPKPKKSAAERLRDSAFRLFKERGANVSLREIAHDAGTREETAERHYRDINGLLALYVGSLLKEANAFWNEAKRGQPKEAGTYTMVMYFEQVLKNWAKVVQRECLAASSPLRELTRIAAQLSGQRESPILAQIEHLFAEERRNISKLCTSGPFHDGEQLANHITLLVHGARNQPRMYYSPAGALSKLIENLLHAHHIEPDKEDL